jgi:hypothetical protein
MLPNQKFHVKLFPRHEKGKFKIAVEADRLWITGEWVAVRTIESTERGTRG